MNYQLFELQPLHVSEEFFREAVRCVAHTILFNRAMNTISYRESEADGFHQVYYVRVDDVNITNHVEESLERFSSAISTQLNNEMSAAQQSSSTYSSSSINCRVYIGFYEKAIKQAWVGILGDREEKIYWEKWCLPLTVQRPYVKARRTSGTVTSMSTITATNQSNTTTIESSSNELIAILQNIVMTVNKNRDHLPPLQTLSKSMGYPFDLLLSLSKDDTNGHSVPSADEESSWTLSIKKIFKQGPPNLMKS